MKTNIFKVILLLVNVPLCTGQTNEELSHFIYALPIMEGMELVGSPEQEKMKISNDIEIAIITKVLNRNKGQNISAEKIGKFYYDHFVSLNFKPWQKENVLSGRYLSPRLVTQGEAHIGSEGHVSFWIPKDGNSVTFYLYQRRTFNIRQSQSTIDRITSAFKSAAGEFGYSIVQPQSIMVSDWPIYLENECFVDRIIFSVNKGEISGDRGTSRGTNESYMFYLCIFPTVRHAEQWQNKTVEDVKKSSNYPNWFEDGLGISPIVIKNIVVEYRGKGGDKADVAFRKMLLEELEKIKTYNEPATSRGK
jgi:hypothetical protein